jgi:hypothetical protein
MLSLASVSDCCLYQLAHQRLWWGYRQDHPSRIASYYSQHTMASKTAIDFKNVDGSPSGDNPEFGMRAGPWHWQYRSS